MFTFLLRWGKISSSRNSNTTTIMIMIMILPTQTKDTIGITHLSGRRALKIFENLP